MAKATLNTTGDRAEGPYCNDWGGCPGWGWLGTSGLQAVWHAYLEAAGESCCRGSECLHKKPGTDKDFWDGRRFRQTVGERIVRNSGDDWWTEDDAGTCRCGGKHRNLDSFRELMEHTYKGLTWLDDKPKRVTSISEEDIVEGRKFTLSAWAKDRADAIAASRSLKGYWTSTSFFAYPSKQAFAVRLTEFVRDRNCYLEWLD